MKHLIFTSALLLNSLLAFGQITINAGDLPVIGLDVEQGVDTMPQSSLQPGGTGPNTWDFSDLEDHVTNNLYFRSPQGLPFANKFPGATLAVDQGGFYQYIKLTSQIVQILGTAGNYQIDDTTSFDVSVPFSPPQTLLQLPATYNQAFDENIRQVIQLPLGVFFDSIRIVTNAHRVVKIDAYGMVKTPAGEFNSLRVKEHAASIDSTYAYAGGFWLLLDVSPYPDTSVNFSWWGKINGYTFPLAELEMAPDDIEHHVQSATWVKSISTGTHDESAQNPWLLYPNPARESVNIEWPEDLSGGRLELYDLSGRMVVQKNIIDQPERLNLRSLSPGVYTVVLKNRTGRIAGVKVLNVR